MHHRNEGQTTDVDDLSILEILDEQTITHALQKRYEQGKYYTYIGEILIAFNPYKPLSIYTEDYHAKYSQVLVRSSQPPHIFWVADKSYSAMLETGQNQCILVSGESGAGKTESTKYIIRHLMHISPCYEKDLVEKIVQINPLLEAFGNAVTLINNNSSRFVKFTELHYMDEGNLYDAKIDTYLLQKSRVVHRTVGEKNFHIFYALFAGMSRERLLYYFLEDPDSYRIMRNEESTNGVFQSPEEFNFYKRMFDELVSILHRIGFKEEHTTIIFMVLAAVLHLANIMFLPCEQTDGVTVTDEYPLHAVAKLLGIEDEVELTEALVSNVNYIRGERIQSWKSRREANAGRDALAKEIYSRLFGWIVGQINRKLWPSQSNETRLRRGQTIGLLDISGFENFQVNSFEQLLVNLTNEKLQQYFMENMFHHERKEYDLEGIQWKDIHYRNNDQVIDLVFKPSNGILILLDEESNFPQSSDETLVQKLHQYCSNSEYFISTPDPQLFGICHYAEKVIYNAKGFLEKNRDTLSSDLMSCLLNSQNSFIQDLVTAPLSATGSIADFTSKHSSRPQLPSLWPLSIEPETMRDNISKKASFRIKKGRTVASSETAISTYSKTQSMTTKHFKRSLADLMTKLSQAQPMFVRCIKPNLLQHPGELNNSLVQRQLICNGCLEIAQLRRDGHSIRIKFDDFLSRYGEILKDPLETTDPVTICKVILQTAKLRDYDIGRTKIFLKCRHKDDLEIILAQKKREKELEKKSWLEKMQPKPAAVEKNLVPESIPTAMPLDGFPRHNGYQHTDHNDMNKAVPQSDLNGGIGAASEHHRIENDLLYNQDQKGADNFQQKNFAPIFDKNNQEKEEFNPDYNHTDEQCMNSEKTYTDDTESTNSYGMDKDRFWRPYDIFQIAERHFADNDAIFKEILKLIRVFMYIFVIVSLVGGSATSKISLLLIASNVRKGSKASNESATLLLLCLCGPIAWNWLMSLMKVLFGRKEWPSLRALSIILLIEGGQTFGVCLFLFKILSNTDMFRGVIITLGLGVVPTFLKVLVRDTRILQNWKTVTITAINILALLSQMTAIPVFSVFDFVHESNFTVLVVHNSTSSYTEHVQSNISFWELPLSILLISLGWWENFVSNDWQLFRILVVRFKDWRALLHDVRDTSAVFTGPFKIGLAIFFSRMLVPNLEFTVPSSKADADSEHSDAENHFISYSLLYLQIGSGIIVTYLAGLACKLHMQKSAFAVPLAIAPLATIVLILLQCRYDFTPNNWYHGDFYCPEDSLEALIVPIICAVVLWLSYLVTVSHIWSPKSERMAKIEKLFVSPHFDGIFPDLSLTFRRRRNDKEVRIINFDRLQFVGDDSIAHEDNYNPENLTPMVYVCATMWHETKNEMTQLLKSLFRLDYVRCASRLAQEKFKIRDPDYFDLEIHIVFDDAWEINEKVNRWVPNSFVIQLVESMEDAARSVTRGPIFLPPPSKSPTPYGCKLTWIMPGHTKMVVHAKNKNKIRHRKRWSQCMYMYYLLGYRLLGGCESEGNLMESTENLYMVGTRNRKKLNKPSKTRTRPLASLFRRMRPDQYQQAENTFILTLDGDVDFKPDSVKLLIDRMKKNRKVGAVCGRIHPIGGGPMVWYQQFEYAVGHWLQKAAEHVFGCVLCCPGCFSLFRGSALMDDNVLKMYTTKPTEARHYIQFEQGEDRWLCTLLLQQGHRIDYCAGADALTFAPETFQEFFNQRRRWSPSTLANMMDLLASWRDTVNINDNISRPYILYQFVLMASSILGPSTIILMITGSYHSVLKIDIWPSYLLSIAPVVIYLAICMTLNSSIQITAAAVFSAFYTIVMMIATVGTIISIATENFGSPNVVFLTGLSVIFFIAGILHPQEFFCLVYGLLYFLTVPSTFILLTVYYLCNLNNVSWGTREVPRKLSPEEEQQKQVEEEQKRQKKRKKSIWNVLGLTSLIHEIHMLITNFMGKTQEPQETSASQEATKEQEKPTEPAKTAKPVQVNSKPIQPGYEPNPDRPYWLKLEPLGSGKVEKLCDKELEFWNYIIKRYLHPLDEDKSHKQKIKEDLISLKNNIVFIYFMINFLWTIVTLQLQAMEGELKGFYIIKKYEPLSLMFLSVFAIALGLQFFSMFLHRWGTFLHLMSSTRIDWFKQKYSEEDIARFAVQEAQRLQTMEPAPDYQQPSSDGEYEAFENYEEANMSDDFDKLKMYAERQQQGPRFWQETSHVPPLQQIFERRLDAMKKKWQNGDQAEVDRPFQRVDSKRHSKRHRNEQLRREMYNRTFRGHHKDNACSIPIQDI